MTLRLPSICFWGTSKKDNEISRRQWGALDTSEMETSLQEKCRGLTQLWGPLHTRQHRPDTVMGGQRQRATVREHRREHQAAGKASCAFIHAKAVLLLKTLILQAIKVLWLVIR